MAILIRRPTKIGDENVELKTYQPAGSLTKEERLKADRLDIALRESIYSWGLKALKETDPSQGWVCLYYSLGRELRAIIDNNDLVSPVDVRSGLIWRPIWEYLPKKFKEKNKGDAKSYEKMQKNGFDPLSIAYNISKYEWADIRNIRRQDDWNHLSHRPAILRDERILKTFARTLGELDDYPSRSEFHKIIKKLGKVFPSRKGEDSTVLTEEEIVRRVRACVFLT